MKSAVDPKPGQRLTVLTVGAESVPMGLWQGPFRHKGRPTPRRVPYVARFFYGRAGGLNKLFSV